MRRKIKTVDKVLFGIFGTCAIGGMLVSVSAIANDDMNIKMAAMSFLIFIVSTLGCVIVDKPSRVVKLYVAIAACVCSFLYQHKLTKRSICKRSYRLMKHLGGYRNMWLEVFRTYDDCSDLRKGYGIFS